MSVNNTLFLLISTLFTLNELIELYYVFDSKVRNCRENNKKGIAIEKRRILFRTERATKKRVKVKKKNGIPKEKYIIKKAIKMKYIYVVCSIHFN